MAILTQDQTADGVGTGGAVAVAAPKTVNVTGQLPMGAHLHIDISDDAGASFERRYTFHQIGAVTFDLNGSFQMRSRLEGADIIQSANTNVSATVGGNE